MTVCVQREAALEEALAHGRATLAPRLRGLREFFEQEIVLPDGPHQGLRWRADKQPWVLHWFAGLECGRWRRRFLTAPTQTGKSLHGLAGLAMYYLFERRWTIVVAAPNDDVCADKWRETIRPAISASRKYKEMLPKAGAGSRGGRSATVTFTNATTLRWMTGGGGDKSVASFTARAVLVTEVDGMDDAGEGSREADRMKQIEARTMAFGDQAEVIGECTLSTREGRTWREIKAGTDSKIALRCVACREFVLPEREHLVGWQAAENVLEAQEASRWMCPACGVLWSEADRLQGNKESVLLHGDQRAVSLPDGGWKIEGEVPPTDTFGLRVSAANNMFQPASMLGKKLWLAARGVDEEGGELDEGARQNAEKELCQFYFAEPYDPPKIEVQPLTRRGILGHVVALRRGVLPAGTVRVTCGVDLQKAKVYWLAVAWVRVEGLLNHKDTKDTKDGGRGEGAWMYPHVVEYGSRAIDPRVPVDVGTLGTLESLDRDVWAAGWQVDGTTVRRGVDVGLVDSGWYESQGAAYEFSRRRRGRWYPSKGHSAKSRLGGKYGGMYVRPEPRDGVLAGDGYHLALQKGERVMLVHINADAWKTRVHESLHLTVGTPGAVTICAGEAEEHERLVRHLTAEKREVDTGVGGRVVVVWRQTRRGNHLLDCGMEAWAAGHYAGIRRQRARVVVKGRGN